MTYHRDYDSWQGDPADNMEEMPEPTGLRLAVHTTYPGKWSCTDIDTYSGPGDILGSGDSAVEATADWAEQYGERCYERALTEAYDEVNALGGADPKGRGRQQLASHGYNLAIDHVLKLLVERGALTVADRRRRNER